MTSKLEQISDKLVDVSMGRLPADLLLKNCTVLNPYSDETIKDVSVVIYGDRIASVGHEASDRNARKMIDLGGSFISPGLMDAHTHLDFLTTPSEFARQALQHGTVTLFADPVDIVSVLGYRGFKLFLRESRTLPIRVFTMVPMALPQDPLFSSVRQINYRQAVDALGNDDVLGLGEVFSWARVLSRERELFRIIRYALSKGKLVNGHTAGARGSKLGSYISAGIFSCHEPINYDEVMERLRLGVWVMLREGSIRRDMEAMARELQNRSISFSRIMLASDGVDPEDMVRLGYMDHCLRLCVRSGIDPAKAVQMGSLNTATYYGLDNDLGGIAPGKLADIVVFKDLDFAVERVFVGGVQVVDEDGKVTAGRRRFSYPAWAKDTMNVGKRLAAGDFMVRAPGEKVQNGRVRVVVAEQYTEILTREGTAELKVTDGNVRASKEDDLWKVAVIDRHHRSGKIGLGFMKGLKVDVDALAGSMNVDENQLVVIGTDEGQMAVAANAVIDMKGGFAVVEEGMILAKYQMSVAGVMSSKSYEEASREYQEINDTLSRYGSPFEKPVKVLQFVTFVSLPQIRFTERGMVNVKKREYESVFAT